MDCANKHEPREGSFLRGAIVEEIARLYCTTVSAVEADISAMPVAKEQLEQFCEAMEGAGY
jgi:hypothetical protein